MMFAGRLSTKLTRAAAFLWDLQVLLLPALEGEDPDHQ